MPDWSLEAVRYALATARDRGFAEIELEASGTVFSATLTSTSAHVKATSIASPEWEDEQLPHTGDITAALVGYYQPTSPPLQVGQRVQKGDVVAVITALGLANDVESNVAGEVVQVFLEAGQSVQYGQALARVRLNP